MADVVTQSEKVNGAATNGAPPPAETPPPAAEPDLAARRKELSTLAAAERQKHQARIAERAAAQQATARAQAAEQRAAQLEAQWRALEQELADPLAFVEKRGVTARSLGERIVKQGTPDEQLEQLLARVQAAETGSQQMRQELAQREAVARAEQATMAARRQLVGAFEATKATTPILAALGGERVIAEYMDTYQRILRDPEAAAYATQYSDAEILAATEERLRADLETKLAGLDEKVLEGHLTKRRGTAPVEGTAVPASGTQGTKAASSSRPGKTLTSAAASGSVGGWKPDNWEKLSDKKQNEILIARIKAGQPID